MVTGHGPRLTDQSLRRAQEVLRVATETATGVTGVDGEFGDGHAVLTPRWCAEIHVYWWKHCSGVDW